MVYSTCSMNPVENEAVVAEVYINLQEVLSYLDFTCEGFHSLSFLILFLFGTLAEFC